MATEFLLPDIGEGLTEAEIIRWMVAVGEEVALDQPLVEVETAKAVVEIPAPRAGVVLYHGGQPGEVVEVGAILAVIGDPGEVWPAPTDGAPNSAAPAPLVGTLPEAAEELPTRPSPGPDGGPARVQALPVVRKLAREAGIDLARVNGSGPGGRVTRADVQAAISAAAGTTLPSEMRVEPSDRPAVTGGPEPPDPVRRVRMSMLRRTIAEHMRRSWSEIPHVTTFDAADAGRLLDVRTALAARHQQPIPIEALVAKAVIPAVLAYPEFNATIDGDDLLLHSSIHLGVAVDTEDGLLVPVIEAAEALTVLDLAARVQDLGERGRTRTLQPDELSGATFTLSNIGAIGGGYGTPIVPHGTTAILSVGRAVEQPVVRDGAVTVAPMMPLSLSFDHRVIDGGLGRRFMALLLENLSEPALFLA